VHRLGIALIALVMTIILEASMATAVHAYGWHSTPGIWLALLNLPGIVPAIWILLRIGSSGEYDSLLYVICGLVNWVFYFGLISVALILKRKL
jgi:hypothetical protein